MLHAFYHPRQGLRLFTDPAAAAAWLEPHGQELGAVFALSPATLAEAGPQGDWATALALLERNYYVATRSCTSSCYAQRSSNSLFCQRYLTETCVIRKTVIRRW